MWWPPDCDVVATKSLSGGHHIIIWIKNIFCSGTSGAPYIGLLKTGHGKNDAYSWKN